MNSLSFIFTEDSFRIDRPEENYEGGEELKASFLKSRYDALFRLGFNPPQTGESPSLSYLRKVAETFLKDLQDNPDLEIAREWVEIPLSEQSYDALICAVPFTLGAENINRSWLALQYMKLQNVYSTQLRQYDGTVRMFLTEKSQDLRVPERVFFHLVENTRDDGGMPFAFMATYATRDPENKVRHMPLSYALEEYKHEREKLIELLSCLERVSAISPLIGRFVESGELFHPLKLNIPEAYEILNSVEKIEDCGVICRVPNWWRRKYSSVSMSVKLGDERPSMVGFDSLISLRPQLMVDGMPLTKKDIEKLLKETEGLALLKGKWIEVDHGHLKELLKMMEELPSDISLLEALKMDSGVSESEWDTDRSNYVTNGKWLGKLLQDLRQPAGIKKEKVPVGIDATLRSYQETGFRWLCYMEQIGFGACLADDMGLGKTLQVLTFLQWYYSKHKKGKVLLVVPASLIGNWKKEAERFAPKLPVRILHGQPATELEKTLAKSSRFLNITTYGMALRMKKLQEKDFDYLILDEAQAIKNPAAKQTRAIKGIKAAHKIAMTGTPIENDLSNLWSLFDFLNKGLLGTPEEFREFSAHLTEHAEGYQKLRNMISPFILRRLKSDKKIIADLPDKVEKNEYIDLAKKQIVLYRKTVSDLEVAIEKAEGIQRRGIVLAYITKLKQICNHPDQYLGQERYAANESGKFELLRSLCETIYEKRERVLVFTQYKEIIPYLKKFLEEIFQAEGSFIHGGVPVKRRQKLVDEFNGEDYVPFMILSLKAGGTGLNLTAANHVIHFDRWWNPAVENQATDRAYRIGQDKSVIVHKFVSNGTIEEKIDAMLRQKTGLADSIIGSSGEQWITELSNDELMQMLRLDI